MSFILDALERSRQERDVADGGPDLSYAVGYPGKGEGRSPWVPVLLTGSALALVLALTVIAWLFVSRPEEMSVGDEQGIGEEQATATAASVSFTVSPPLPLPIAPGLRLTEVQAAPEIPVVTDSAEAVGDLYRAAEAAETAETAETVEVSETAEVAETAQVAAERRSDTPVSAASVDIDAMVAQAEAALDSLDLAAHPAPMLEALSQTLRDGIPTLMYSQHDYRSSGESAVFINRERHREGDNIGGVRVQEILPDSVILSYRGTEFRLKALNSWVNL